MMYVNYSLISLKCVLFLFFGAIGSLLPFIAHHVDNVIVLPKDDSVTIWILSPLLAAIGPLVVAPLADRLAGGVGGAARSKTGRYLRVMISFCIIFATIFYWLVLVIPQVTGIITPNVTFTCDDNGGVILQDRCGTEKTCYDWRSERGEIFVKNCTFTCNATSYYPLELNKNGTLDEPENILEDEFYTTTVYPEQVSRESTNKNSKDYEDAYGIFENEGSFTSPPPPDNNETTVYDPLPHMCHRNETGSMVCDVYTRNTDTIKFYLGLQPADNAEIKNESCQYPFGDEFKCPIFPEAINISLHQYEGCKPKVICEIHNPYNSNGLLWFSQCGYSNLSFWLYLIIRTLADMFTAAAVTLLATAVVIATRETSTGRGDIGKQFALGALGFGIFAPIIGGPGEGLYLNAMICFTVLMVVAVLILLFDEKMPLSPPEWWWHTRCGLLALPMSSVRKYKWEIASLVVVLFLLGIFWNAIDTFVPWYVTWKKGDNLTIGLTLTVGALPAVIFLIFAEIIVDYCGHNNLLIFCFINYIIHHAVLAFMETLSEPYAQLLLACEWLEVFTLHIMYITAVLYLRHLVPRKFTACGQALPVIAHFCLGRCFGALFGGMAFTKNPNDGSFYRVYSGLAIAAAVIAVLYFLLYHLWMKPKCTPPVHLPPEPAPAVIQSMNGNGSYTPLRVYHNSKSKKGYFRY